MADPTYGQYPAFVAQYGSGAAGVDNFASQVLQANPGATLGDFYATYVLGTGNPAYLATPAQLAASYPSAYDNLLNNAGVPLDTPLASLVGATGSSSSVDTGATGGSGFDIGQVLGGVFGSGNYLPGVGGSAIGAAAGQLAPGAKPASKGPLGDLEAWLTSIGQNVAFVIVGLVLLLGALYMLAVQAGAAPPPEKIAEGAGKIAGAALA